MFTEPAFLLERFSKEKLEQAFWAIMGGSLDCSVEEVIWDNEVPFEERANCVRAMYFLYEKLFAIDPLYTSSNMWWDALAYDWHCDNRNRSNGGEDLSMQDVMFETLERILGLSSRDSQGAALHGLGHLHHPNTVEAINAYLKRNPRLDSEMANYARAASRFEVLTYEHELERVAGGRVVGRLWSPANVWALVSC
ncbi:MAG: hypothetical protein IPG58_01205 [Acidobacteria bacterium]|nr:hypothetical protein [Acidobacteriota bacterium]